MHRYSVEEFSRDVALVYQAGLDPSLWGSVVERLDAKLDRVWLSLYGSDAKAGVPIITATSRYSEDTLQDYADHYADVNMFVPRIMSAHPGEIRYSDDWVDRETLLASEFYNDFLRPEGKIGSGGGGAVFNEDGRVMILSGQVPFDHEDDKTPELIETLRLFAPHVRNAFRLHRQLEGHRLDATLYRETLEHVTHPVFLLGADRRIRHANTAAEVLLAVSGPLCVSRFGELRARMSGANHALRQALSAALDPASSTEAETLVPLDAHRSAAITPFVLPEAEHPCETCLMLTVLDARRAPGRAAARLARTFGLTDAETALALGIAKGAALADLAEKRGISVHTARTQLKAVFAKTDTRRQAELAALVYRFDG